MLRVVIGSKNKNKVNAVIDVFGKNDFIFDKMAVQSGVSDQPFSDNETIQGAVNRAKESRKYGDIGIGLEAGVQDTSYGLSLINWGALVDENDNLYIAGGTRILLPDEVANELSKGLELAEVMDTYCNRKDIRSNEGAIGIFTNNEVVRKDIFTHISKLLLGQYLYNKREE